MLSSYRGIHIPDDDDGDVMQGTINNPPFNDMSYILITGATASSIVAKVDLYYVYEF
jgi:hypothetical protein